MTTDSSAIIWLQELARLDRADPKQICRFAAAVRAAARASTVADAAVRCHIAVNRTIKRNVAAKHRAAAREAFNELEAAIVNSAAKL